MTPWILICAALITLAYAAGCRQKNQLRPHYEEWAKRFYGSMKPLIQDDETPLEALVVLRFLNSQISERKAARAAFFAVWQLRNGGNDRNEDQLDSAFEEFIERRPELGDKLHEAFVSALLAVSFNSLLFGFLLRRTMLFDIKDKKSKRAESIIRPFLKKFINIDANSRKLSPI